jgi:hypothetical protein
MYLSEASTNGLSLYTFTNICQRLQGYPLLDGGLFRSFPETCMVCCPSSLLLFVRLISAVVLLESGRCMS